MFKDYYRCLNIDYTEDILAITVRALRLLNKYDPSNLKEGILKDAYTILYNEVEEAFSVLSNSETKEEYDQIWRNQHEIVASADDAVTKRNKKAKIILSGAVVLSYLIYCVITFKTSNFDFAIFQDLREIKKLVSSEDVIAIAESGSLDGKLTALQEKLFSSIRLNSTEENFLWNDDLLKLVLPYYDSETYAAKFGWHHNLDIVPFTDKEKKEHPNWGGFYDFKNRLHIRDYEDTFDFNPDDFDTDATAHEYVHLLQVCPVGVLGEASAELITREFFLKNVEYQAGEWMPYFEGVRLLKMLMEVIGPEPVWRFNFEPNSTALYDAVKDYLTEEQLEKFKEIVITHPDGLNTKDQEELYSDFKDIIRAICMNKYGIDNILLDMDEMFLTVQLEGHYIRTYFNYDLEDKNPSCVFYDGDTLREEVGSIFAKFPEQTIGEQSPEKDFVMLPKDNTMNF